MHDQYKKIIRNILKIASTEEPESDKVEFNTYCSMILKLESMDFINYLDEKEVTKEIEHLIRASYPSIPKINFQK